MTAKQLIAPSEGDALSYRRRRLRGDLVAACAAKARPRWVSEGDVLARENAGVFYAARIAPRRGSETTEFTLEAKPMALDRVLWDILEMPEAAEEPLPYRAVGAFTCSCPPFATELIEDSQLSAREMAERFLDFADREVERAAKVLAHSSFAEFLSSDPDQIANGAYAIPLFCAHVAEGGLRDAWAFAEANQSGDDLCGEDDFFGIALDWLACARQPRTLH